MPDDALLGALWLSVVALAVLIGWLLRGAGPAEARRDRVEINTNAYGELEE